MNGCRLSDFICWDKLLWKSSSSFQTSVKQKSKRDFISFKRFFLCCCSCCCFCCCFFFICAHEGYTEGYGLKSQAVFRSVCVIFLGHFCGARHQPASQRRVPRSRSLSKSLSCRRHFACVALGLPAVEQQLSVSLSDSYSSEWKTMDLAQGVCVLCAWVLRLCDCTRTHTR